MELMLRVHSQSFLLAYHLLSFLAVSSYVTSTPVVLPGSRGAIQPAHRTYNNCGPRIQRDVCAIDQRSLAKHQMSFTFIYSLWVFLNLCNKLCIYLLHLSFFSLQLPLATACEKTLQLADSGYAGLFFPNKETDDVLPCPQHLQENFLHLDLLYLLASPLLLCTLIGICWAKHGFKGGCDGHFCM